MKKSIGIVETSGLAISYQIADAMLKATTISIVRQELIDIALITLTIEGDSTAVQQAIKVGVEVAKSENQPVNTSVLLNPDVEVRALVEEIAVKQT